MAHMLLLPFAPLVALLIQNIFYLKGAFVSEQVSGVHLCILKFLIYYVLHTNYPSVPWQLYTWCNIQCQGHHFILHTTGILPASFGGHCNSESIASRLKNLLLCAVKMQKMCFGATPVLSHLFLLVWFLMFGWCWNWLMLSIGIGWQFEAVKCLLA